MNRTEVITLQTRRAILYPVIKRLLDILVSAFALIFATPVILLAAIAIRMETVGSPFFLQTRIGRGGKPFKIFKLRGMYADARERFPELYDYQRFGDLNFYFHHISDPRITRVGAFLRKTSIDEFPNFLNVLIGNMSLVGPRPEIPEMLALYGKFATPYIAVKPGVTCLSKVSGRDRLTKEESIRLDLEYIQRMSLTLDLKIMWRTFRNVLSIRDVFHGREIEPRGMQEFQEEPQAVSHETD